MKYLVIYAHPNPQSLNGHLREIIVKLLEDRGHEVRIRDLYHLKFNPVLSLEDMEGQRRGQVCVEVKTEQDFITWADCLLVIHPIWWTGLPAILKGYIDRVFSYGFAYQYKQGVQKGLLNGKQIVVINTHGKSKKEYQDIGMDQALVLTSDRGIYAYSGLEITHHFFFDQADSAKDETIEDWKSQIKGAFLL
ncbi:NAD(P)H-dependent oxidoreductase [Cyclobacterium qasimii]|uniref:NAD(P)H oxidoreductase n=2 Tax=Cyclobacterium qasimii TaxID=1350429 RepID=S7VCI5_9BACT|nr:NAD(P)H-dependent oxidoreductase [Cyclobacterium qasimii]EPR67686.1 NAD(P)H oxidoreductase [Cyclobacterium qasimii M12-11B]GEO19509.1 NAD(P)H dehydrogenase [Cyclobacterium qasimii]